MKKIIFGSLFAVMTTSFAFAQNVDLFSDSQKEQPDARVEHEVNTFEKHLNDAYETDKKINENIDREVKRKTDKERKILVEINETVKEDAARAKGDVAHTTKKVNHKNEEEFKRYMKDEFSPQLREKIIYDMEMEKVNN